MIEEIKFWWFFLKNRKQIRRARKFIHSPEGEVFMKDVRKRGIKTLKELKKIHFGGKDFTEEEWQEACMKAAEMACKEQMRVLEKAKKL